MLIFILASIRAQTNPGLFFIVLLGKTDRLSMLLPDKITCLYWFISDNKKIITLVHVRKHYNNEY